MDLELLHTADWHLGNNKTLAHTTTESIRQSIIKRIPEVDIITIIGDIFDKGLSFISPSSGVILSFLHQFFSVVRQNNTHVIIVRGTIFHDRNQISTIIETIVDSYGLRDLVHVVNEPKVLTVLDKTFLCVPDDLPFKNKQQTMKHLNSLLIPYDGKVDYCLIHGMFDFAIHGFDDPNSFTVKDFAKLIRILVLCGHVHRPQKNDICRYCGSIDRIAHGEEHNKGFFIHKGSSSKFIVNERSVKYITIDHCKDTNLKEVLKRYDTIIEKEIGDVEYAFIRVILDDLNMKQALRKYHSSKYQKYQLTFKPKKKEKLSKVSIETKRVQLETPTTSNLSILVHKQIGKIDITLKRVREVLSCK